MSDTADKMTSLYRPGEQATSPATQLAQVLWLDGSGSEFFFQNTNGTIQRVVFFNQGRIADGTLTTPSVLAHTALAAVNWKKGDEVRLYYQEADTGAIFEQAGEKLDWSYHPLPSSLTPAVPGTGLAALSWGNGTQIRVYSQNVSQAVQAYVYSQNAWSSDPNPGVLALEGSALAAIGWNNGVQQRLYFLAVNGAISESVYAGGWQMPTTLLALDRPTALAAVSWGGTTSAFAYVRVYYQDANDIVRDLCYNGGTTWTAGTLQVTNAQAGTSLCAVQLNDGTTIRVTYVVEDGGFGEAVWDGNAWAYHSQTG